MEEVSPTQKNCQEFYHIDAEPRRIWPRSRDSLDSIRCCVAGRGHVAIRSRGMQDSVAVTDSCVTSYGVHVCGSGLSSTVWRDKVSA